MEISKLSGPSLGTDGIAKINPAAKKKDKSKKVKKEKPGKPKLTGLAYYWNKIENVYEGFMQVKQFTGGAQMQSQDDKKLEKFEPENDNRGWTRNLGHFIFVATVSILIINVIVSSVNQIGTQKTQSSTFSSPSQIVFSLEDLENLLEVKMFANMSTQPIERSMDCHVNNNKQVCLNDGAKKCDFTIKEHLMSAGP